MMPLVAILLLFTAAGAGFILVHLVAGKFIRPARPDVEKGTIYECGEPTIGSAWIQFDLRFYVVALLFVIFDVEVAFFFPWAEVFGKANNVAAASTRPADGSPELKQYGAEVRDLIPNTPERQADRARYAELTSLDQEEFDRTHQAASGMAWVALLEILVFFGVLLVGFAYLWRRGDLEWVRSVRSHDQPAAQPPPSSAVPVRGARTDAITVP
jgi:NADH-quinone oxidoreductase subunit A